MKKKLSIEDIEKSVNNLDIVENSKGKPAGKKTKVPFAKKKKRRIRRYVILAIIIAILAGLGWFGWVSYNSFKNIFGGEGAPGLLGLFDKTQLKGEGSGRVNVLLLGVGDDGHAGATLSDTIMVLSIDTKNNKAAMISIPRDLYVKINGNGYAKINSAHAYAEKAKEGTGPEAAKETVSEVLGIPIHYYIRVNFTGFKKIVDAIGGVDINVEKNLYDPYYPGPNDKGYVTVNIKAGNQHMNGDTALKYARSRQTTSDFDRGKRQQQVMVAIKDKILSPSTLLNPKKLADIIGIVGEHLATDFKTNEFQRVLELAKKVDSGSIVNKVLDNTEQGLLQNSNGSYGYALIPRLGLGNYKDIQEMAKNIFNEQTIKSENARIAIYNGTTKTGLATQAAEKLKAAGYNVVYYGTATTSKQTYTTIKDYSGGNKPKTIDALKTLLNASSQTATGGSYDIEIILGTNYK